MPKFTTRTILTTLAAAGLLASSPALAGDNETMSIEVSYRDLDLSTADGQRTLERRLHAAAEKICGIDRRQGMRLPSTEARSCMSELEKGFSRQVALAVERDRRG